MTPGAIPLRPFIRGDAALRGKHGERYHWNGSTPGRVAILPGTGWVGVNEVARLLADTAASTRKGRIRRRGEPLVNRLLANAALESVKE